MLIKLSLNFSEVKIKGDDFPKPGPILIGVSGGSDSVALVHILKILASQWKWKLFIGHIDYGIRSNSYQDALFVENLARELKIGFLYKKVFFKVEKQESLEAKAREIRRKILMEMAIEIGASVIALAHQANDQSETVLSRILQGTGISGLAAMRMWNPPFWRPFLEIKKKDIYDWLNNGNYFWREDSTNIESRYLRNRVRYMILPMALKVINIQSVKAMCRLSSFCADEEDHWKVWCHDQFYKNIKKDGFSFFFILKNGLWMNIVKLRRILRYLFSKFFGEKQHILALHIKQVEDMITKGSVGKKLELPRGIVLWKEKKGIRLDVSDVKYRFKYVLDGPGWLWISSLQLWLSVELVEGFVNLNARGKEVYLPAESFNWPMVVRSSDLVERFLFFGFSGLKKLGRFFIDQKISIWWRRNTLVLQDQRNPFWIAPWSLTEFARSEKRGKKYLKLKFIGKWK